MASTSSVYGSNRDMPLHETQKCDTQMSFYAATKKSNESMAHSYSNIWKIPITMLRFFTVYGPLGRPDMAYFLFTDSIKKEKEIWVLFWRPALNWLEKNASMSNMNVKNIEKHVKSIGEAFK